MYLPPLTPLPTEPTRLGIVMVGTAPVAWNVLRPTLDFFDLKGAIDELLARFNSRTGV